VVTHPQSANLTSVWVHSLADGLIRADQIIGIETHRTPAIGGKPSRWLLDVVVNSVSGGGATNHHGGDWAITPLHRTLTQSTQPPHDAPTALARLLAQLNTAGAAGIITTHTRPDQPAHTPSHTTSHGHSDINRATLDTVTTTVVRFRFTPFTPLEPERHTDTEYAAPK
jgi:hypothetical protein